MREHQIVITLKPEQFLEVQRMARSSGAKSMGMFVRQKLLSVLGLDGTPPVVAKAEPSTDVVKLAAELRRLHGELKTFVAESMAEAYIEETPESKEQGQTEEADQSPATDEVPLFSAGYDFPYLPGDDPVARADSLLDQALQDFDDAQDELEQLAQKAFAISPRLGSLSTPGSLEELEHRRRESEEEDPLDELLEDPPHVKLEQYIAQAVDENADEFGLEDEADEEFSVHIGSPPPDQTPPVLPRSLPQQKTVAPAEDVDNKPAAARPAPPPPPAPPGGPGLGFSGGPPPRKRQ